MSLVPYPLTWPDRVPRTRDRQPAVPAVSMPMAVSAVRDELALFAQATSMPVSEVVISSNVAMGHSRPSDPGVAVYFRWDGAMRCIAIDRFRLPERNLESVARVIHLRRDEMAAGGINMVRFAFAGFVTLPADDWRSVLAIAPDERIDAATIVRRYRAQARSLHPDLPTGSAVEMATLNAAKAQALREIENGT